MWNQYANKGTATGAPGAVQGPQAGSAAPGAWHPTVLYLIGLVVAEVVVLGFISHKLLK